jgi:Uma2 family endonuclease
MGRCARGADTASSGGMTALPRERISPEDFLAMERDAVEKHMLWDGAVSAMAGATPAHNFLVANAIAELHRLTRRGPCRVGASDLKVYVPQREGFVYPDASVVCGALSFYPGTRDVITNPTVLLEVLSDSTERLDRGDKASGYRAIASLRHHLIVSQTERRVEVFTRHGEDAWLLREYRGADEAVLEALDGALRLDELYLKVLDGP